MASTYSTNLAIELIGTGDQAGSWGNTTNSNLGTLIEQAISGYVTQAVSTGTDTTITIPNGSSGVARNMYIELTGTGGTNTNLIVPANKKLYFIFNNSTGAVTVKVSGQTGVSVPTGKKMVLVSNGTDIVNGLNYIADFASNSATITHLSATSATITNLTLTSLVISNLSIASANITTLTGSTQTLSGNLTLSGGTANGVLYLNGSKVATSGTALTFDGTNLGIGTTSPGYKLSVAGASGSAVLNLLETGVRSWGIRAGGTATNTFDIADFTAAATRLTIDSSGNLGIGTTTPSSYLSGTAKLVAYANANAQNSILVRNDSTGASASSAIALNAAGNTWGIEIGSSAKNSNALTFQLDYGGTNSTKMTLDSSGNLGLGVTPSAWSSTLVKAIQIADNGCSVSSFTTGNTSSKILNFNNNAYYDAGGWKYVASSVATSRYELTNGEQRWYTAPSGTAGNAISFTQAMTLDASGTLIVGSTSSMAASLSTRGQVSVNGSTDSVFTLGIGGTYTAFFYAASTTINFGSRTAIPLTLHTNDTERARIDASGNLGLGVTPSAWSLLTGLQVKNASLAGYLNNSYLFANSYYDGSSNKYIANGFASYYEQSSGRHLWYNAASGTAGNAISFTQAMTLDASGNLGIGTTSPGYRLQVDGASTSGFVTSIVAKNPSTNGASAAQIAFDAGGTLWGAIGASYNSNSPYMAFFVGTGATTERARITSGGNFIVGGTSAVEGGLFVTSFNGSAVPGVVIADTSAVATANMMFFHKDGAVRGSIQTTASATSYNTSSDRRLKDNIAPADNAGSVIDAIEVVKHDWKVGGHTRYGMIAQDLHMVAPEAVSVGDDGEELKTPWGVDYSKLVPMLVKEVQSLRKRVAELESK